MAHEAVTWAWSQTLTPNEKIILVYLADRADENYSCWPGQKTIAAAVGLSERGVRDNLARLETAGLIVRRRRHRGNGSRTSDRYFLTVGGLPADDDIDTPDLPADHDTPTGRSRHNLPATVAGAEEAPEESPGESPETARARKADRKTTVDESGFMVDAPLQRWARDNYPEVDIRLETDQFRDHHRKLGTKFIDWPAAWRTWIRNVKKFGGGMSSSAGQPPRKDPDAWMQR